MAPDSCKDSTDGIPEPSCAAYLSLSLQKPLLQAGDGAQDFLPQVATWQCDGALLSSARTLFQYVDVLLVDFSESSQIPSAWQTHPPRPPPPHPPAVLLSNGSGTLALSQRLGLWL